MGAANSADVGASTLLWAPVRPGAGVEAAAGDTVIVQGSKSSAGTITATQINATAAGATSGLAQLFGGGGFGGGGGQGPGQQRGAPQPDGG